MKNKKTMRLNKWFPWTFWWNLFEFFCNGDLPMTFARPRLSFARRSLGETSLRSMEPRFARRDGLASLGGASLRSAGGLWKRYPLGRTLRGFVPPSHGPVPHGPPLKVLWTSGVVPPDGKNLNPADSTFQFCFYTELLVHLTQLVMKPN